MHGAAEQGAPRQVLEMTGIGKRFPGVDALRAVDFAVAAGEIQPARRGDGCGALCRW